MNSLKKYLDLKINTSFIGNPDEIKSLGITPRYIPDSFEYLDEMEFLLDYKPEIKIVFTVAVEGESIKRMMFGWVGPDDDEEAFHPLPEEELQNFFTEKEKIILAFFDRLTKN